MNYCEKFQIKVFHDAYLNIKKKTSLSYLPFYLWFFKCFYIKIVFLINMHTSFLLPNYKKVQLFTEFVFKLKN